ILYILPWYQNYSSNVVAAGLMQSTIGMLAFTCGSLLVAPIFMKICGFYTNANVTYTPHRHLPRAYIVMGGAAYLLLYSFIGALPTANALLAVGQQLFVVGLCLACWWAWHESNSKKIFTLLAVTLALPFFTVTSSGFISQGVIAVIVVFTFVSSLVRSRAKVLATALVLGYLGLSVYVTYMRDRYDIRQSVWGGEPWSERLEEVYKSMSAMEWFDPYDDNHLKRIDARLNQNYLVGMAVTRMSLKNDFAYGETIWGACLALIPRALWPEKPLFAGSGHLVSDYTGIMFAPGTSVGIGQVMEFYINFGTAGVIFGFLFIGIIVAVIDSVAAKGLLNGDWQLFALLYLIGISLLQVGGSLVEIAGSAGASVALALIVNKHFLRHLRGQRRDPALFPTS
ncbi:MAG: hypothetical protein OEN50_17085, partial [Deltaproteobacteria bacterium]|nr:hypothetical protein [Deltaproteobacteria bacterium]